ncbi:MAG: 4Fe-4S dicluster domain-containing protein [bacterium]|nr:4Fe-4S dicluster domain-containing protein [bacterium]
MPWSRIIFTVLFIASIGLFLFNVYRLIAMLCLGRWENRFDHLLARLKGVLLFVFGQKRVVRRAFGVNHFFIFWGFMILLGMNSEFLIQGVFPEFSLRFLGRVPYGALLFATDIMSVVVLAAVALAVMRRIAFRPKYIEASRDAFLILGLIAMLMVAYFGVHAAEIALGETDMGGWMPVSGALAGAFATSTPEKIHRSLNASWWVHALALLAFLNYLPYSKHLHVLTAIPNVFFRRIDPVSVPPRLKFELGQDFGVSKVTQFTWKQLLDFMACTECGRCEDSCPAHGTGKDLSPKEMVHRGKLNLFINGGSLLNSRPIDTLAGAPREASMVKPLIDGTAESIPEKDVWSCATCGVCMEECPVFIEHAPKTLEMRRHLVMEKAEFPEELLSLFNNMEQRFNPWGIAPTDRAKWAQDLDIHIVKEDAPADYLFFVGCSGAYDSRARGIALAMAKILDRAGLSWGILGTEEKCCGDSLRRLGNEYVFDQIAQANVAQFKKLGITKVVTHCPHCYTTLKNDYRAYGAEFEVIHHSELIERLIAEGKLPVHARANGRVVYHDSCYLGRHNGLYDAPRHCVEAVSGQAPAEMERSHGRAFCCGAGGGRMWLEETEGKRINIDRTEQALKQNPAAIASACPFCMTMLEDGLKDLGKDGDVKVKDIAELVADAIE